MIFLLGALALASEAGLAGGLALWVSRTGARVPAAPKMAGGLAGTWPLGVGDLASCWLSVRAESIAGSGLAAVEADDLR